MIQWQFVFAVLWIEIGVLSLLILPIPAALKKVVMKMLTGVWNYEHTRRALIGCFFVIVVLFGDTLRSMWSITHRADDEQLAQSLLISLFRQQRNAYLCGFVLLLLLVLYRIQAMLQVMHDQETKTSVVVTQAKNNSNEYKRLSDERDALSKRLKSLEDKSAESSSSDAKTSAVLKQAENQAKEYSRLVDENKKLTAQIEKLEYQLTTKAPTEKKND